MRAGMARAEALRGILMSGLVGLVNRTGTGHTELFTLDAAVRTVSILSRCCR